MDNRNEKGQLQAGHPGFRKKGTLNKVTAEVKQRIERVLDLLEENLDANILALSPKEQVQIWMDLQEFIRPKLQRSQTDLTTNGQEVSKITFEVLHGNQSENKGQ